MDQHSAMWQLTTASGWEFVVRAVIVYGVLLLLLRLGGKREIGQMAPFDLVLLLLVSNAVQNSMNAGDNSVTAGIILVATLVAVNYLVGLIVAKNKRAAVLIEGQPQLLIHNGRICHDALKRADLSLRDLEAAMRLSGLTTVEHLHYAILETNGQISFKTLQEHEAGMKCKTGGVQATQSRPDADDATNR